VNRTVSFPGGIVPPRHNTGAPDVVVRDFAR
jgi:hypothetical protein